MKVSQLRANKEPELDFSVNFLPARQSCRSSAILNTMWIGEQLGAVERACLRSMLQHGHQLVLWCYEIPAGVPEGVILRDAAQILPGSRIIRHRSGSVSLFSNHFRYELQRRGLGVWVDADMYLLRPLPHLPDYVFAWEGSNRIGTAVLRLPSDSPLLHSLLEIFAEKRIPRWIPLTERIKAAARLVRTGRSGLAEMPWGAAGPSALTYLVGRHHKRRHALPSEMFFPVHWSRSDWIIDPNIKLEDVITPRTIAVHLWNEMIKEYKDRAAPAGSFLARLQMEEAEWRLPRAYAAMN